MNIDQIDCFTQDPAAISSLMLVQLYSYKSKN